MNTQKDQDEPKGPKGLETLIKSLSNEQNEGGAPVHLWDPPFCGDIDICIKKDGSWTYNGSPIKRHKLVKLFSSVLTINEAGEYFLVTPAEKVRIAVEDLPFVATSIEVRGENQEQIISFSTNVGDHVLANENHQLELFSSAKDEEQKPSIHIRRGLKARIARPVYYELAELVKSDAANPPETLGIWSAGHFFAMAKISDCP